jgi:hypothetical protein
VQLLFGLGRLLLVVALIGAGIVGTSKLIADWVNEQPMEISVHGY